MSMAGRLCPSPRLRTLMVESVRLLTSRVPTWVGRRRVGGGGRRVYLGLKRIAPAVVSCSAMASGEGGAVAERAAEERDVCCAVVGGGWHLALIKELGWAEGEGRAQIVARFRDREGTV